MLKIKNQNFTSNFEMSKPAVTQKCLLAFHWLESNQKVKRQHRPQTNPNWPENKDTICKHVRLTICFDFLIFFINSYATEMLFNCFQFELPGADGVR